MTKRTFKLVHYINQFFAGIGGEEMAGVGVNMREGPVGPGLALKAALGDVAEIVSTIVCGDNYCSENQTEALAEIVELVKQSGADALVAGPAFNAGRYGMACGAVCEAVQERLGIPACTSLYPENPAVERYRSSVLIVPTEPSAIGMRQAVKDIARIMLRVLSGQELGPAADEGYIPHGLRKIEVTSEIAAHRAVNSLLDKIAGRPYETEVPLATYEQIVPAEALKDISRAKIALVTEGGLVPVGNPDRIRHVWARNWASYSIEGMREFEAGEYEGVHGGFDRTWVNEDPDRLLPLDIARQLEEECVIGELHGEYYVTVGNGTPVKSCSQFGAEIAQRLLEADVQAALVSSTWATGTRCGATLAKEIERAGIPAALFTAMTSMAEQVGAPRIIIGGRIPHPVGNPNLPPDRESVFRRSMVMLALKAIQTEVEEPTVFALGSDEE